MRGKWITTADVRRMIALYKADRTFEEVAAEIGCSRGAVGNHLRANGIRPRPPRPRAGKNDGRDARIIAAYRARVPVVDIAERFGLTAGAVYGVLNKHGVAPQYRAGGTPQTYKELARKGWATRRKQREAA